MKKVTITQEVAERLTEVLHRRVRDVRGFESGEVVVSVNPGYGMCCECGRLVGDAKKARSLVSVNDETELPVGIHIQQDGLRSKPIELTDLFDFPMMWLCLECAKEVMGDLLKGV